MLVYVCVRVPLLFLDERFTTLGACFCAASGLWCKVCVFVCVCLVGVQLVQCHVCHAQGVAPCICYPSSHDIQATVKAAHHLSHVLPCTRGKVARQLLLWLGKHAYWDGEAYSSWRLADVLGGLGVTQVWDTDIGCLQMLAQGT